VSKTRKQRADKETKEKKQVETTLKELKKILSQGGISSIESEETLDAAMEQGQSSNHLSSTETSDLLLRSQDNEEEIQYLRREAYIELPTQILLRNLLKDENRTEITPTYDPAYGFIYETVETVFGEDASHEKAIELLERLAQLDVLKKSLFDAVSACPSCQSTILTLHYRCPKCKGRHVSKTSLTEHIPCGYIDERGKFTKNVCPKCGEKLATNQYRDMGRWYVCKECGEKFEHPQVDLKCRKCLANFTIEKATVNEISQFSLNVQREKEIRQNVASLESINKLLTDLNFSIQMPGSATGEKSGIEHHFSLLAKKEIADQEKIIAVDHAVDEKQVQASPLILYIYKISEVRVDLPIFVAIPKLSETAKKIAQGHNILFIEGTPEEKSQINEVKKEIEDRLGEKTGEEKKPKNKASKRRLLKRKKVRKPTGRGSNRKAQLYSPMPSIHPYQQSKNGKKTAFVDSIRRAMKRNKKKVKQ